LKIIDNRSCKLNKYDSELKLSKVHPMPTFGECKFLDSIDFVVAIDKEDPRVFVVVHVYDTTVSVCNRMNKILCELAIQRPSLKFICIETNESGFKNLDKIALPILNIYKDGVLLSTCAGIANEFGNFFTSHEVEWLLENEIEKK